MSFSAELKKQRWDDHRLYHHSRVNQSLHLLSALTFIVTYALCFVNAAWAAFLGWFVAMWIRQAGHFFFEPKGFDVVNDLDHAEKEAIKVGYNLRRKVILLSIWIATPVFLILDPSAFGLFQDPSSRGFVESLGILWFALGIAAVFFRTIQLCFIMDAKTGIVWFTKILTDPFHDLKMYYIAPIRLLQGEWIDPMGRVTKRS